MPDLFTNNSNFNFSSVAMVPELAIKLYQQLGSAQKGEEA